MQRIAEIEGPACLERAHEMRPDNHCARGKAGGHGESAP